MGLHQGGPEDRAVGQVIRMVRRNNQMNILMEMLNTTKVIKQMEKHHLKHQIIQSLKKNPPLQVISVIKHCPTYNKYKSKTLVKSSNVGHSSRRRCSM